MNRFARHISSLKLMNSRCRRMTFESLFTRKLLLTIATRTITSYNNDDDPSIHPLYVCCKILNQNHILSIIMTHDYCVWSVVTEELGEKNLQKASVSSCHSVCLSFNSGFLFFPFFGIPFLIFCQKYSCSNICIPDCGKANKWGTTSATKCNEWHQLECVFWHFIYEPWILTYLSA